MDNDPTSRLTSQEQAIRKVRTNVVAAIKRIREEINRDYDAETGCYRYARNHGRLTVAEVLRRAGGVDKNTLKAGYHAKLRKLVTRFVRFQEGRLGAHVDAADRREGAKRYSANARVEWFAQVACGAEFARDQARFELRDALRQLAEAMEEINQLKAEREQLQIELSEGRVVRLFP